MASSTLGTLLEMIQILISNSVSTLSQILGKLFELGSNLSFVSSSGGLAGLIIAVSIGGIVLLLFLKLVMGIGKNIILLLGAGIIILLIIFLLL